MPLLKPQDVATLLSVSTITLEKWRRKGIGPRYLKLNRGAKCVIRYRPEAVDAYLAACERSTDVGDQQLPVAAPSEALG
jgi:hypothetical protein